MPLTCQCSDCTAVNTYFAITDIAVWRSEVRDTLRRYIVNTERWIREVDVFTGRPTAALNREEAVIKEWNYRVPEDPSGTEPSDVSAVHRFKSLVNIRISREGGRFYKYKPGDMNKYLGVELEVYVNPDKYNKQRVAQECQKRLGEDGVIKFDGSITDRSGFEMVTLPRTLYLQEEIWKRVLEKPPTGIEVDESCGVHVHVSRDPLSKLQIAKLVMFTNLPENKEFISFIAGRGESRYTRILKRDWGYHKRVRNHEDRYNAVNLLNRSTIEFRIFSGSLDYDLLMVRLEFVRSLIDFCSPGVGSCNNLRHGDYIRWLHNEKGTYPYTRMKEHLINNCICF